MMDEFIEDGVVIQGREINAKELSEREQWAVEAIERNQAELDKLALKQSAIDKLTKLGLTAEETQAIIGL
jgi:hypothetical protein